MVDYVRCPQCSKLLATNVRAGSGLGLMCARCRATFALSVTPSGVLELTQTRAARHPAKPRSTQGVTV